MGIHPHQSLLFKVGKHHPITEQVMSHVMCTQHKQVGCVDNSRLGWLQHAKRSALSGRTNAQFCGQLSCCTWQCGL
jgi:hypothetical protein